MFDDKRWFYKVGCINKKTGERRDVVVEFSDAERRQLLEYEAFHPGHVGGPEGPIAKRFALDHADKKAPPGFVPVEPKYEIERIPQTNLRVLH
jgi:hypothetical protein